MHQGKQLIKCCPEQLRRASERQALIEELSTDTQVPWTFTKVATETAGINSKMSPEKHPMTKNGLVHRILNWRTNPPYDNGFWGNDPESGEPVAPPAQRPRQQDNEQMALFAEKWQERVPGESWGSQPVEFWMQHNAAVALERHRARQTTEV